MGDTTSDIREIYASIVTADSLMLYAQGATDIYHAILPHVTNLEDENDDLRMQLETAEKKSVQLKAEIKRQVGMVKAYRANAEKYERERTAAVKKERNTRESYKQRIRILHAKWSTIYQEQRERAERAEAKSSQVFHYDAEPLRDAEGRILWTSEPAPPVIIGAGTINL